MAPKSRRPSEDEIRRRWAALDGDRRQALLRFDDPVLVERIKASLQTLFEKQMLMLHLGISLGGSADPFAASALFTSAFEFTWQICRSARNPNLVLVDPSRMPVLVMKSSYLEAEGDRLVDSLRAVLPDLLSEKSGRSPMPRARWKDLWASEPASIQAIEQQLVKLVEQALWTMGADPAFATPSAERTEAEVQPLVVDEVPLEQWMLGDEERKMKTSDAKKKKRKKVAQAHSIGSRETASEDPSDDCVPPSRCTSLAEEFDADSERYAVSHQGAVAVAGPVVTLEEVPEMPPEELHEDLDRDAGSEAAHESERTSFGDESVGVGKLNIAGEAADFSTGLSWEPTASSTPAADSGRVWGRSSPMASHKLMHPPQLVCYIWNQTSQFAHGTEWPRNCGTPNAWSSTTPASAEMATPCQASTPFSRRGQWMDPSQPGSPTYAGHSPVVSAVVRNTFVDIDDPQERSKAANSRASRSLSPPHGFQTRDDWWHDHWHV